MSELDASGRSTSKVSGASPKNELKIRSATGPLASKGQNSSGVEYSLGRCVLVGVAGAARASRSPLTITAGIIGPREGKRDK